MIPLTLNIELQQRVAAAVTHREAALDVLKELQRHYGWLTDQAVMEAADILELSPLQVEELATFYEMIYRRPVGKKVIHVCDSISCWSTCCEKIMAHLQMRLGVSLGGTSADGTFTLIPCCCMGMCGDGPVMSVGSNFYLNLTPERVDEILEMERRAVSQTVLVSASM